MKYDNHKTGCAASSDKCSISFQLAVNTLQTTTTGPIDLEEEGGGGGGAGWGSVLSTYGPHGEPGASERLLSA